MAVISKAFSRKERGTLASAFVITRREIKDNLRDWRIMAPIFTLTLIFPALMNVTATLAMNWVAQYDALIVGERLIPFLLMIVGFFPISFSLVIALETFAGEKERNSIEPLLSMPLTDLELYLGKMLAAVFVPLTASYLGITVYLVGLRFTVAWSPDIWFLIQIFVLTTVEGLVMVSGAVVVSSQTTSVRAANLLASFIIVPMALLVQGLSILLFYARYDVIWLIIVALLVIDFILIRMGVRIFNREEILSREMDTLNLKTIWLDFKGYFLRSPQEANNTDMPAPPFSLKRVYKNDIPYLLKTHLTPILIVIILLLLSAVGGYWAAPKFVLPLGSLNLGNIPDNAFEQVKSFSVLPDFSVAGVFFHNVQVLLLAAMLGLISFAVAPLIMLMIPVVLIGYFTGAVTMLGYNPAVFVATFILPHGILELPAAIIVTAFILKMGAGLVSPPKGYDLGQGLLLALANLSKIFIFLALPMLLMAALIEVEVTLKIVRAVYGGG